MMTTQISRYENRKRSFIKRLLSRFINNSNTYIVQYLPDFIFSGKIDFHSYRKIWIHQNIKNNDSDLIRMLFILSNLEQIQKEGIEGDFAELGVFRGNTAKILHTMDNSRNLYLFDTFSGFSGRDLTGDEPSNSKEGELCAGINQVKSFVGTHESVKYIPGYFPDTTKDLPETIRFSFVSLDVDLYEPTKNGLEYFYKRLSPGGMIMIHDYANSGWPGVKKAADEFLASRPESLVILPDKSGTAVLRKSPGLASII